MIKKQFILIAFFIFLSAQIVIAITSECWNVEEIADLSFIELDELIAFSFKDAVTCDPVINAKITIANQTLFTDAKGYITLPTSFFESIKDDSTLITAKKNKYCTLKKKLNVMNGTVIEKRFIMSKRLPAGKARFVLQWGEKPKDLDLHLVGNDFHVSFRNMKVVKDKARLDRDDITSYGPETITLDKIVHSNTYTVYVHNYSGEAPIDSFAKVFIYQDNRLDRVLTLPKTNKKAVKLIDIIDGIIVYNQKEMDSIPK